MRGKRATPLTPEQYREREAVQVNVWLTGTDKDFVADLLEAQNRRFPASGADIIVSLIRAAQESQQQPATT